MGIGILLFLPMLVILICGTAFWIWMLIDCAAHEPRGNDKIVWVLILIFLNVLGAILYFLIRRLPRHRQATSPAEPPA